MFNARCDITAGFEDKRNAKLPSKVISRRPELSFRRTPLSLSLSLSLQYSRCFNRDVEREIQQVYA